METTERFCRRRGLKMSFGRVILCLHFTTIEHTTDRQTSLFGEGLGKNQPKHDTYTSIRDLHNFFNYFGYIN